MTDIELKTNLIQTTTNENKTKIKYPIRLGVSTSLPFSVLLSVYKYPLISSILYQPIPLATLFSINFLCCWEMNPFFSLFLASCLFFISHSQTNSNTSSQHHCLPDQSHTLLQLRQEFVQKRLNSDYYPKMKSWKANSDCCFWDGVTCDPENGHMVGLNLTNSWLNGRLNSNSSLFSLHHLHKLKLAFNNFSSSTIPPQFGQLVSLTHLNLSFFSSYPAESRRKFHAYPIWFHLISLTIILNDLLVLLMILNIWISEELISTHLSRTWHIWENFI